MTAANFTRSDPISNRPPFEGLEPTGRTRAQRRTFDILSCRDFPAGATPGAGWGGRPAPAVPEPPPRKLLGNREPPAGPPTLRAPYAAGEDVVAAAKKG